MGVEKISALSIAADFDRVNKMENQAPEIVVTDFYKAFQGRNGDLMASLYADTVVFSDPVFPNLVGTSAKNMWKMLCGRSKDLRVEFDVKEVSGKTVTVIWQAWYTFSTGRKVHNIVTAELTVEDSKIFKHTDRFSFWRWSRQALGVSGYLLGWTPILPAMVRKNAAKTLASFQPKS